ncbi:MAG: putative 4-hydroxybenzoate polyprenyltransferase [Saprospiraceae bacterium]|nr:putative 4-hydroxybenzoate polyprenyltransferase [Saprospiraceae bacterium]
MKVYFNLVKFSHTIFALPFALTGLVLGFVISETPFSWERLLLVLGCMVTARNTAMAFNRYIDKDIDAANERTKVREIPSGKLSGRQVVFFIVLNAILFIALTWLINPLCFYLSPVALMVIMGYSLTKRFTFLCHLILGTGLSLAPIGAFIAVTGYFHLLPIILGLAVLFWVSGFDIIYALQDEDFDKSKGLFSIPSFFGANTALKISRGMHVISAILLIYFLYQSYLTIDSISTLAILGTLIFISRLIAQHLLVTATDLSKVNMAFFTNNGIASVVYGVLFMVDLLL